MRRTSNILSLFIFALLPTTSVAASTNPDPSTPSTAWPIINVVIPAGSEPQGLTPYEARSSYHLSGDNGTGTLAIITAYKNNRAESNLEKFNKAFGLRPCTSANGCFERHSMSTTTRQNSGWALQAALDTQWAHAIAPHANILLVEAKSAAKSDLSDAIAYARSRSDVRAVSMSWNGNESADQSINPDESYSVYYSNPESSKGSWYGLGGPNASIAQENALKTLIR